MKLLHDMTDAERAEQWTALGMFRYSVLWRAELAEQRRADEARNAPEGNLGAFPGTSGGRP